MFILPLTVENQAWVNEYVDKIDSRLISPKSVVQGAKQDLGSV